MLNYQTIETHPERISKLKPYINNYNWKGIDFPAGSKDWVKFEKNNETIALDLLYLPYDTKTISVAYKSKYNNERKKQVILLMITNANHDGDFYCLNCFSLYTTRNKLKEHEEICNNHDSYRIGISSLAAKTLEYIPGEK